MGAPLPETSEGTPREVPTAAELARARRVLVGLRWGIGDLVTELPALAALRRACPRAEIVGVGADPAVSLLDGRTLVNRAVAVQDLGLAHLGDATTGDARRWLGAEVAAGGFDFVFDTLHVAEGLRGPIYAAARAGGWRVHEASQDVQNEATRRGDGIVDGIARGAAAGWGVPVATPASCCLDHPPAAAAWADNFLAGQGLASDARPAAVSAVASHTLKRWPVGAFAEVAAALARAGPTLIVAGPDAALAENLARRAGGLIVVPRAGLNETAALLGRCRLFVGNDTGLTHLAAAAGCATIGVFGPTEGRTLLPNRGHARHVQSPVPCEHRPSGRYAIPRCWVENRCLLNRGGCVGDVTPAAVLAAAGELVPLTTCGR